MQVFENGFHVVALPRVSIASYTCLLHSMTPEAQKLWRAPQWAFSILLALLGMLGPFSIDTYLPAFAGISQSLGATPVQMQQTLSAYLFGFAFMALFHGSISDSFVRKGHLHRRIFNRPGFKIFIISKIIKVIVYRSFW